MKTLSFGALLCVGMFASSSPIFAQGSLTPPGAPAPTMKSLDQIEPRTPISSLPYTISTPGSYYLTKSLTVPDDGTLAITVAADNVTIDLCGFSITATGSTSSVSGISVPTSQKNLCVRNGSINGWGSSGITAFTVSGGLYEGLFFSNNQQFGLRVGASTTIRDCEASGNNLGGLSALSNSVVIHCTAINNKVSGITCVQGTLVDCVSNNNPNNGITVERCVVRGCMILQNFGDGIAVGSGCLVVGNMCFQNNSSSTGKGGMEVTGTGNRIESNNFAGNSVAGLQVTGTHNIVIANTFTGPLYIIASGNTAGPFADMTAGGVISTSNPWTNFAY
jgi:hypothetical protein